MMSGQSRETVGKVVPVGYKQTEVGVIPEDWDCLDFSDIFTCRQGMQVPVEKQSFFESTNTVRFIRIIDLTDKQEPPRYISNPGDKYVIKKTDLFMVRYGVPGLIGFNYQGVIANNLFRIIPRMSCSTSFYAHYLSYRNKDILDSSGSSTMPAISFSTLARFKIIKPQNEKEQTAIANALSDVDALISEQEKLIAKKQAIKTATMQQLLTGRTLLPQFALREDGTRKGTKPSELGEIPEDWEVFSLLDIANLIHGKAHEPYVVESGKYVIVNSKFVSTNGKVRKYCSQNDCAAKKGDILMVLSDLPNGKALAKCFYADQDDVYAVNQRICIFRTSVFDSKYLQLILNRHKYFLALDDGVTQTHILNGDIAACQLFAPFNREEQSAIATILADMDEEIQALEQRLGKTRQIKQGMMQELLTGKTRLVKPESAV